jgi:signal transduction histidine kinase
MPIRKKVGFGDVRGLLPVRKWTETKKEGGRVVGAARVESVRERGHPGLPGMVPGGKSGSGSKRWQVSWLSKCKHASPMDKRTQPPGFDPSFSQKFLLSAAGNSRSPRTERAVNMQAQSEKSRTESFVPLHADSLHDLAGPVNQISTMVDLLLRRDRQQPAMGEETILNLVRTSTARLLRLVGALQEFTFIAGPPPQFRYSSGNTILAGAIASLSFFIRESGAKVTHEDLPQLCCDSGQMTYVFTSLIENAIKFRSEAPPRVQIAAADAGGYWLLSVRDNGIGIDSRHRESIFHMFQRINGERYPGAGAGLAISRHIIEQHGGRIWVESEPDRGSKFFFTLPAG